MITPSPSPGTEQKPEDEAFIGWEEIAVAPRLQELPPEKQLETFDRWKSYADKFYSDRKETEPDLYRAFEETRPKFEENAAAIREDIRRKGNSWYTSLAANLGKGTVDFVTSAAEAAPRMRERFETEKANVFDGLARVADNVSRFVGDTLRVQGAIARKDAAEAGQMADAFRDFRTGSGLAYDPLINPEDKVGEIAGAVPGTVLPIVASLATANPIPMFSLTGAASFSPKFDEVLAETGDANKALAAGVLYGGAAVGSEAVGVGIAKFFPTLSGALIKTVRAQRVAKKAAPVLDDILKVRMGARAAAGSTDALVASSGQTVEKAAQLAAGSGGMRAAILEGFKTAPGEVLEEEINLFSNIITDAALGLKGDERSWMTQVTDTAFTAGVLSVIVGTGMKRVQQDVVKNLRTDLVTHAQDVVSESPSNPLIKKLDSIIATGTGGDVANAQVLRSHLDNRAHFVLRELGEEGADSLKADRFLVETDLAHQKILAAEGARATVQPLLDSAAALENDPNPAARMPMAAAAQRDLAARRVEAALAEFDEKTADDRLIVSRGNPLDVYRPVEEKEAIVRQLRSEIGKAVTEPQPPPLPAAEEVSSTSERKVVSNNASEESQQGQSQTREGESQRKVDAPVGQKEKVAPAAEVAPVPNPRPLSEAIADKDLVTYQGVQGFLEQGEDGALLLRPREIPEGQTLASTPRVEIAPAVGDKTFDEVEGLSMERKGQKRRRPARPAVVASEISAFSAAPAEAQAPVAEAILAEHEQIPVPARVAELNADPVVNGIYEDLTTPGTVISPERITETRAKVSEALAVIDSQTDLTVDQQNQLAEPWLQLDDDLDSYEQSQRPSRPAEPAQPELRAEETDRVSAVLETAPVEQRAQERPVVPAAPESPTGAAPTGAAPTGAAPTGAAPTGAAPSGVAIAAAPAAVLPGNPEPVEESNTTEPVDSPQTRWVNSTARALAEVAGLAPEAIPEKWAPRLHGIYSRISQVLKSRGVFSDIAVEDVLLGRESSVGNQRYVAKGVMEDLLDNVRSSGDPFTLIKNGKKVAYSVVSKASGHARRLQQEMAERSISVDPAELPDTAQEPTASPEEADAAEALRVARHQAVRTGIENAVSELVSDIRTGTIPGVEVLASTKDITLERSVKKAARAILERLPGVGSGLDWMSANVGGRPSKLESQLIEHGSAAIQSKLISSIRAAVAGIPAAPGDGARKSPTATTAPTLPANFEQRTGLDRLFDLAQYQNLFDQYLASRVSTAAEAIRSGRATDADTILGQLNTENLRLAVQQQAERQGIAVDPFSGLPLSLEQVHNAVLGEGLPEDFRLVWNALQDRYASNPLAAISQQGTDPGHRVLAKALLTVNPEAASIRAEANPFLARVASGMWMPGQQPGAEKAHYNPFLPTVQREATILHELTHAIMDADVYRFQIGDTDGMAPEKVEALQNLDAIRRETATLVLGTDPAALTEFLGTTDPEAQQQLADRIAQFASSNAELDLTYPLASLTEFISGVMSNAELQSLLASISTTVDGKRASLWDRIVAQLLRLVLPGRVVAPDSSLARSFSEILRVAQSPQGVRNMELRNDLQAQAAWMLRESQAPDIDTLAIENPVLYGELARKWREAHPKFEEFSERVELPEGQNPPPNTQNDARLAPLRAPKVLNRLENLSAGEAAMVATAFPALRGQLPADVRRAVETEERRTASDKALQSYHEKLTNKGTDPFTGGATDIGRLQAPQGDERAPIRGSDFPAEVRVRDQRTHQAIQRAFVAIGALIPEGSTMEQRSQLLMELLTNPDFPVSNHQLSADIQALRALVPVVPSNRFDFHQMIDEATTSKVFLEAEDQSVYKLVAVENGTTGGFTPGPLTVLPSSGDVLIGAVGEEPRMPLINLLRSVAISNTQGSAVYTEIAGVTEDGDLILKQPYVEGLRMAENPAEHLEALGMVQLSGGPGVSALARVRDRVALFDDLHGENIMVNAAGEPFLVDALATRLLNAQEAAALADRVPAPRMAPLKFPEPLPDSTPASFAPQVFTAEDRSASESLHRAAQNMPDPVQRALSERTIFSWAEQESLDQANGYIAARGNDLQRAVLDAKNDPLVTQEQLALVKGIALKRANNAAAAAVGNPLLSKLYLDLSLSISRELADQASQAGSSLRVFRTLADLFTPQNFASLYSDPLTKAQTKALQGRPLTRKVKAALADAETDARDATAARVKPVLDAAKRRRVPKDATAKEVETAETLHRYLGSPLPIREQVANAAVDAATAEAMANLERALGPQSQSNPSFLDALERRVRADATEQLDTFLQERLIAGTIDESSLTPEEVQARQDERLADMWRGVGRLPLAENVFYRTVEAMRAQRSALYQPGFSDVANLLANARFDAARSDALHAAVTGSVAMEEEIRKALSQREVTVAMLQDRLLRANPELSESQARSLSQAVEAVYNQEVSEAARAKLNRIADFAENPREREPLPSTTDRLVGLINMGAFNEERFYNALAPKFGLPSWDPVRAAQFAEEAALLQQLPENSVQRDEATQILLSNILRQHIKDAKGMGRFSHLLELSGSLWTAGVLSGPPTHVVNATATAASVLLESVTQATGHYMEARVRGVEHDAAWEFFRDVGRAFRFAYGKDAGNVSSRVMLEAETAMAKGTTRFKSEKQEALALLEHFDFNDKWRYPGSYPAELRSVGRYVADAAQNFPAAMKYVGRAMLAADSVNSLVAVKSKQIMAARALALEEKLDEKALAARMNEIFNPSEEILTRINTVVDQEEAAGNFGIPGSRDATLMKARRREQLLEQETYSSDVMDAGRDFAAYSTFNGDAYGLVGMISTEMFGRLNNALGIIAKPINPFPRTASNLINAGLNWSPYGFLRAQNFSIVGTAAARTGAGHFLKQYVPGQIDKGSAEYYAANARAAAGTAAIAIFAAMVLRGLEDRREGRVPWLEITANGPGDFGQRKQWLASGGKPWSITIAGKYSARYTDWPALSMILGAMGTVYDKYRFSEATVDPGTALGYAVASVVTSTLNRNMLSGASNFFEIIADSTPDSVKGSRLKQLAGSYVGGITNPQALRWLGQLISGQKTTATNLQEWAAANTPVGTFTNQPAYNILGEDIPAYRWDTVIGRLASPVRTDPILTPLTRKGLWLTPPARFRLLDPKTKQARGMTDEEFYTYGRVYGQELKKRLTPSLLNGVLRMKDPTMAQNILNDVATAARLEAQRRSKLVRAPRK